MIKRKTYSFRGGDILDIEEYHDGRYGAPGLKRMKRRKATKEDMLRVNKWNKEKRCRQRLLQYFKETDLFLTWTYSIEERPPDMQAGSDRQDTKHKKWSRTDSAPESLRRAEERI